MKGLNDRNARKLSDILGDIADKYGWSDKIILNKIQNSWNDISGKNIFDVTSVEDYSNGVLTITTESPVWKNELFIRREQIKSSINNHFKKDFIKEIKIKLR